MTPDFKGGWLDCLEHLSKVLETHYPRGSRNATTTRQPMAKFCGVDSSAVTSWVHSHGKQHPAGLTQLKLMFFLDLQGYTVTELRDLGDTHKFAELVAFGVVTVDSMMTELGYSNTTSLYRVLFGASEPPADKADKMFQIWKAHKDELNVKKTEARERFVLRIFRQQSPATEAAKLPPSVVVAENKTAHEHTQSSSGVIDIMAGLLKLLDQYGQTLKIRGSDQHVVLRLSSRLSEIGACIMHGALANNDKEDDHE